MSTKQLPKIITRLIKSSLAVSFMIILLFTIIAVREGHGMPSLPLLNNFLVSHIVQERDRAKKRIEIMMINLFTPRTFIPIVDFMKRPHPSRHGEISSYLYYYERIIEYAPERAEAHGILGFSYYHLGKHKKAAKFYENAIEINPDFFWFPYNLGIIHFKNGDYKIAAELLETAIQIKPENTLNVIYLSKIYSQIRSAKNFQFEMEKRLKLAYKKCYALLALSHHYAGNPSFKTKQDLEKFLQKGHVAALPKEDTLSVEMF